jgi:hypothetical protein
MMTAAAAEAPGSRRRGCCSLQGVKGSSDTAEDSSRAAKSEGGGRCR